MKWLNMRTSRNIHHMLFLFTHTSICSLTLNRKYSFINRTAFLPSWRSGYWYVEYTIFLRWLPVWVVDSNGSEGGDQWCANCSMMTTTTQIVWQMWLEITYAPEDGLSAVLIRRLCHGQAGSLSFIPCRRLFPATNIPSGKIFPAFLCEKVPICLPFYVVQLFPLWFCFFLNPLG